MQEHLEPYPGGPPAPESVEGFQRPIIHHDRLDSQFAVRLRAECGSDDPAKNDLRAKSIVIQLLMQLGLQQTVEEWSRAINQEFWD